MPITSSGAIYLSDVQAEFGGANPIYINEYYGKDTVPTSGPISLADFYGATQLTDFSGTFLAAAHENLETDPSYAGMYAGNVYNMSFGSVVGATKDNTNIAFGAGPVGNRSREFILWSPTIAAQFARNGRTPNSSHIRLNSFSILAYLKKYAYRYESGNFASTDGGIRMTPCVWNGSALVKASSATTLSSYQQYSLENPIVVGWKVRDYQQTANDANTSFGSWSDTDKANWVANGCPMHVIRDLKVSGDNHYYGALAGMQWTINAEELT